MSLKTFKRLLAMLGGVALCIAIPCHGKTAHGVWRQPGDIDAANQRMYVLDYATDSGHERQVQGTLTNELVFFGSVQNTENLVFDMPKFTSETMTACKFVGRSGQVNASSRTQRSETLPCFDELNVGKSPRAEFAIDSAVVQQATQLGGLQAEMLDGKVTSAPHSRSGFRPRLNCPRE